MDFPFVSYIRVHPWFEIPFSSAAKPIVQFPS